MVVVNYVICKLLHMSLKVKEMCSLDIFNSLIGIDEGPDDSESSSEEIISLISSRVEWYNDIE